MGCGAEPHVSIIREAVNMDKKFYVGVSYYPEHWPSERWETDAILMKEAGFNIVRIAELAWSVIEPEDGVFDFRLFDGAAEILSKHGMQIMLGTPTSIPPQWMWKDFPGIVRCNEYGLPDGGRFNYCANNPDFIRFSKRLVCKMAEHYKDDPAVISWQIDNEFRGCLCYCEHCGEAFRIWLRDKYGTLDNLNKEWGTVFWSQTYNSWDRVDLPSKKEMITNTSQLLDFRRFVSDSKIRFQRMQVKILRDICPSHTVTHNGMGSFDRLDYYKLAEDLDFYGCDVYPAVDEEPSVHRYQCDVSRGIKEKSYWVLEQKNGYINFSKDYNLAIEPGLVRFWAMRDAARGADGVLFYRWRGGRFGFEQHPNGILRHDGSKRRAYGEVKQFAEEMEILGEDLIDSLFETEVAILRSFDAIWALESQFHNINLSYEALFMEYYEAAGELGVNVDIVNPLSDLGKYKVVIAPGLFTLNSEIAANIMKFAGAGGAVILSVRTGVKTWSNTTVDIPWPGLLRDASGCTVTEFDSLPAHAANTVIYKGEPYTVNTFLEVLKCETGEAIGVYGGKFYKGEPAITQNRYGKGSVIYSGAMGGKELARAVMRDVFGDNGVRTENWPEGIEVTYRRGEKGVYMFVLNASPENREVSFDGKYRNLPDGREISGIVEMKRFDAMVLQHI